MELTVHQIYFDESQRLDLEPEYLPLFNSECSHFFENSVISRLVGGLPRLQESELNYFGVVSYDLRRKIGDLMKTKWRGNIANISRSKFSPDFFQKDLFDTKPDAMSFQRHPAHEPVSLANKYHPNFSVFFEHILHEIGYKWRPVAYENVFYCNFFVARNYWYRRYVEEMLNPAMAIMDEMPELWQNSKYPKRLPVNLAQRWGKPEMTWYPYHTFLCERLFSHFAHIHKLNCNHF